MEEHDEVKRQGEEKPDGDKKSDFHTERMALGFCLGLAVGVITNNLGLCLPLRLLFGVVSAEL